MLNRVVKGYTMKKLWLIIALSIFVLHNARAADDIQLLTEDMLQDTEDEEIEKEEQLENDAEVEDDAKEASEKTGFFGFISRPFSKLFSSKETETETTTIESYLERITRQAEEGDVESQMNLAYMYLYGAEDVKQDFAQALKYYSMAASKEDPIALNNLGSLYFNGIGTPRDIVKALSLFKKSAELGNDNAALNLAFIYLTGGKKDADRNQMAIKYFEAAHKNNNIAKFMLGYAYYRGFVVPQDYEKAFTLIREAAISGSKIDEAQLVLAEIYIKGHGTVQNYQNAISAYNAAVKQGNMEAIMILAQIYTDGVICPKNLVRAHSLFNIAAAKNVPEAASKRDELTVGMKHQDLLNAQNLAQSYKARPSELTGYIRQTYGSNIRQYIDNNM